MITRLRPAWPDSEVAELYRVPHVHDGWPDHRLRVAETIALARELGTPTTVADLSCGDAAITTALAADVTYLGDIAPGYPLCGPIEKTLTQIPHVDMLICTETLEHVDDPLAVLAAAREKASMLVLSTPLGEIDARNPEHYWGWDTDGISVLMSRAGWSPVIQRNVHYSPEPGEPWASASYQLWGCV